jgi:predicted dehydrogenase
VKTPQPTTTARRQFLKHAAILAPAITLFPSWLTASTGSRLRIAFIGVGPWGQQYLQTALQHKDIVVTALCEQNATALQETKQLFTKAGIALPAIHEGSDAYETLLSRKDIDAVIIATPWHTHFEIAKAALLAGKHVACGPIMGSTIEEHWDIVNTSKRTGKQYITLDEQSYRRDLVAISEMVTAGKLGELKTVHAGASYNSLQNAQEANCYPVYPAAATAKLLGISEANPYVSVSVHQCKQDYVINKPHPTTGKARLRVNTGLVSTIRLSTSQQQTVYLQSSSHNDQPFSTGFRIQATRGSWMDISKSIYHVGENNAPVAFNNNQPDILTDRYKQPPVHEAVAMALHDFVKTLQQPASHHLPVCAAATNSVIGTLARLSAQQDGASIQFPNFYS